MVCVVVQGRQCQTSHRNRSYFVCLFLWPICSNKGHGLPFGAIRTGDYIRIDDNFHWFISVFISCELFANNGIPCFCLTAVIYCSPDALMLWMSGNNNRFGIHLLCKMLSVAFTGRRWLICTFNYYNCF